MYKKILVILGVIIYAIISHIALIYHVQWLAFVLAMLPILLLAINYAFQLLSNQKNLLNQGFLLMIGGVSALLLMNHWASMSPYSIWIFLAQNAGMNAMLAMFFGATLLPSRTPIITALASILNKEMSLALKEYTRRVTWAWCVFFTAMCLGSIGLFYWAPLSWWSAFINLFAWPLVGVMFIAEYGVRRMYHPEFEKVSIADTIRAFSDHYKRSNEAAT